MVSWSEGNEVTLSLDSTQANYLDGYAECMESTLRQLIGPEKKLNFELRHEKQFGPEESDKISVPTQGLLELVAGELAVK
jgi:hypothetical protein